MPALLTVVTAVNDRRMHRIDRSSDFLVLARWFAQAGSDGEAHVLWRAVFGLCPARHFLINDETLDDYEAQEVPPTASWLDAPPLRLSTIRRTYGRNAQTGGLSRIIDRSREKEKLAAATHDQALAILNAQARFATGRRMRLSDLEELEADEFDLFLDLIGEAVSARVVPTDAVEIVSGDGCLRLRLEPALEGAGVSIATSEGVFSGADHWITIEPVSTER